MFWYVMKCICGVNTIFLRAKVWSIPWKVKAEKMSISLLKHIIYIVYTIMYMFLSHGCRFYL